VLTESAAGRAAHPDTSVPLVLALVEPDTALALPHASWSEDWRPLLRRFGEAARTTRPGAADLLRRSRLVGGRQAAGCKT
jgi:hypothetical protein